MKIYEEATAYLGQWGRFQQITFFLLCASSVQNGLTVFAIVFTAATPRHHCLIPDVNLSTEWFNVAIPTEVRYRCRKILFITGLNFPQSYLLCVLFFCTFVNGQHELSQCSRYRLDVIRNLSGQGLVPGRDVNVSELEQEGCLDGWTYSKDLYQSTIVTEVSFYDVKCKLSITVAKQRSTLSKTGSSFPTMTIINQPQVIYFTQPYKPWKKPGEFKGRFKVNKMEPVCEMHSKAITGQNEVSCIEREQTARKTGQ